MTENCSEHFTRNSQGELLKADVWISWTYSRKIFFRTIPPARTCHEEIMRMTSTLSDIPICNGRGFETFCCSCQQQHPFFPSSSSLCSHGKLFFEIPMFFGFVELYSCSSFVTVFSLTGGKKHKDGTFLLIKKAK